LRRPADGRRADALNHSLKKPTAPFSLMPIYQIKRNTVIDMPSVVLMSAVATTRK